MTRTAWAERPAVTREFCTCRWMWARQPDGRMERTFLAEKSPGCPLHGDNAKETPF